MLFRSDLLDEQQRESVKIFDLDKSLKPAADEDSPIDVMPEGSSKRADFPLETGE